MRDLLDASWLKIEWHPENPRCEIVVYDLNTPLSDGSDLDRPWSDPPVDRIVACLTIRPDGIDMSTRGAWAEREEA
jgi:hypothetical protein